MSTVHNIYINDQGEVGTVSATVLATGSSASSSLVTSVNNIKFYNPIAYTITVSKYDASKNTLLPIYEYQLSAGDTLIDTNTYQLGPSDRLEAQSSVAGTNYFISGNK